MVTGKYQIMEIVMRRMRVCSKLPMIFTQSSPKRLTRKNSQKIVAISHKSYEILVKTRSVLMIAHKIIPKGLAKWIVTNTADTAGGPITEELLNEAVLKAYEEGGEPTVLLVSPANKQLVSKFPGIAEQRLLDHH